MNFPFLVPHYCLMRRHQHQVHPFVQGSGRNALGLPPLTPPEEKKRRSRPQHSLLIRHLIVLTLLITCPFPFPAWAQSTVGASEIGFITGIGTGSSSAGRYHPILLTLHLASDVRRYIPTLSIPRGTMFLLCEPQINPAFAPEGDIEVGVGFGLQYNYHLTDRFSPFIMGTVGPHYITLQDRHQENGFVFASTIGVGIATNLDKRSLLSLGYRYRHLSNGGMNEPNHGINTHFFTLGYVLRF